MKHPKGDAKASTEELSKMLLEWDPIGCSPPPDEYDCLIGPLLTKLRSGCNVEFVTRFLDAEIKDHFGMDSKSCGTASFAAKVCAWFASRRS